MSKSLLKFAALLVFLGAEVSSASPYGAKYVLKVTNGSAMPISPGVVYSVDGQSSTNEIGNEPTQGLIQLCQTGNPAGKISELKTDSKIKTIAQTAGPILPGQSVTVEVRLHNPRVESLHFVAMYGKSKELCAAVDIQSHALLAVYSGYGDARGNDKVISAGAFTEPVVDGNSTGACAAAKDAVSCLRTLSVDRTDKKQIHFFGGYLPSLINFLEEMYGAQEALSLFVPAGGGVSYSLSRK